MTQATEQIESRADLARELTALRVRAGLSVRSLATRLDTPAATIGDYFSGRHLPGPAQLGLYRAVLRELGVTDPVELDAWIDALSRVRRTTDGRTARRPTPYRGLEPYDEADAAVFHGREQATDELLGRLATARAARRGGSTGMLVLVGASGSGKSSLLRAGVLAAVRAGRLGPPGTSWDCRLLTPGPEPLEALAAALGDEAPDAARLLVVDQLEELFAGHVGLGVRSRFLARLAELAEGGTSVVVGLRADFYQVAAQEPVLLEALRGNQVLLGPMTEAEVRRAVSEPARAAGLVVEDALVDLLLADLAPRNPNGFAYDPGALPLLSHALLATWQRAARNELTVADYLATGGIRAAVRQSAEERYSTLTAPEQELARHLFLRLVDVGEDTPLTRRRVRRAELADIDGNDSGGGGVGGDVGASNSAVIRRFVEARLLTADEGTIELSHETLLTAWPRLSAWVEEDRSGLRLHRQLGEAANAWLASGRDESHLLRGSRLQAAAEWAGDRSRSARLNRVERDLVEASLAHADAERRAVRRRARRMQQLIAALVALVLATSGLAAYALDARSSANTARDEALSRQVAIEAERLAPTDPALAMQLAVAAYRTSPTVQARSVLLDATAGEMPTRLLGPSGPTFAATSPGQAPLPAGGGARPALLAVAHSATGGAQLFALTGTVPRPLAAFSASRSGSQVFAVALRGDGRLLATAGVAGKVDLWNLADLARPRQEGTLGGFSSTVYALAFSPDGHELAAASADGTVREWDVADPGHPRLLAVVHAARGTSLHAVAFSPGGRRLAAAGTNGTLLVWPDGATVATPVPGAGTANLETLAFSPTGHQLAVGGDDDLVRVFDLRGASARLARPPLDAGSGAVYAVAYDATGTTLASGAADGTLELWSTHTWRKVASLAQPDPVTSLAFAPGGRSLVAEDAEGVTRLWPLPAPSTFTTPGKVFFFDFTRRSHLFGAVTTGPAGGVAFWSLARPGRPAPVADVQMPARFGPDLGAAAVTTDGRLLALDNAKAQIQLVDVADLHHPRPLGKPLLGAKPLIEDMAFDPRGNLLAEGDDAGQVRLWDVADPARPRALPELAGPTSMVLGVAFSPNGKLLAAASADDHVWLWDVADPARPRRLARLGGFTNYAYSVAFTPDGRTLVAGSADQTVRLWDVSNPAHPRPLGPPLTGPASYVLQVAVSPDGRTLAASTTDGSVWLWDIADPAAPRLLATLAAASGQLFAVGFAPGGRTLVAGGSQATLHFWSLSAADAARRVCALAGTPLTRAEWSKYVQGSPYRPPCS